MGLITSNTILLPEKNEKLELFGFKFAGGAHISKTMMLNEITKLLTNNPPNATLDVYHKTIVSDNILLKPTQSTRQETYNRLRSLYGLDEKIPIFSIYRELVLIDPKSISLLSLLVSWARDPLLRASTSAIYQIGIGDEVKNESIQRAIQHVFPDKFSPSSLGTTSRNTASTWTQSGHLLGRVKKIRTRVIPTTKSFTMALLLGYVCGYRGEHLFTSPFCKLLDINAIDAQSLAQQAHRENLITFKNIGSIIEVSFHRYQRYLEAFQ